MDAPRRMAAAGSRRAGARAGFSLVELMFVILIVFMLVGLLLVGFRHARQLARRTAERAAVLSLRQASNAFEQQTGFFPPLVKDYGEPMAANGLPYWMPPGASKNRYRVYNPADPGDLDYLRGYYIGQTYPDRFSIYSIPYYLIGVGEVGITGSSASPIDGVAGPGTKTPRRDGSFEQAGKAIEPLFDVSKNAKAVVTLDQAAGRVQLQDVHGVAYRFYHWEHGAPSNRSNPGQVLSAADLNVPAMVGDPNEDASLRDAKDAIVAAGPNGIFGDEDQLPNYHPQHLSLSQMADRMNLSGDVADPGFVVRLRGVAAGDNIVEVLHGK